MPSDQVRDVLVFGPLELDRDQLADGIVLIEQIVGEHRARSILTRCGVDRRQELGELAARRRTIDRLDPIVPRPDRLADDLDAAPAPHHRVREISLRLGHLLVAGLAAVGLERGDRGAVVVPRLDRRAPCGIVGPQRRMALRVVEVRVDRVVRLVVPVLGDGEQAAVQGIVHGEGGVGERDQDAPDGVVAHRLRRVAGENAGIDHRVAARRRHCTSTLIEVERIGHSNRSAAGRLRKDQRLQDTFHALIDLGRPQRARADLDAGHLSIGSDHEAEREPPG